MSVLDQLTKSLVSVYAEKLTKQEQDELITCLEILADDKKYNRFGNIFPEVGEFNRYLYPKHMEFFGAGLQYKERGFIAANRVGKSEAGGFETACHATGDYPEWWTGWRVNHPCLIWVGGDTSVTVRDILQKKLIGEFNDIGSGLIPKDKIIVEECKLRRGIADAYEMIRVRHITGGVTTIMLKTYEQGRATWQGTEVDFIWVDEECPSDVYGEALMRIMTTHGRIITTFTPLSGMTELVLSFIENSQDTDVEFPKHVTLCKWADVPHLTEEEKNYMLANTPQQLRKARSEGNPAVGSGLIYPLASESYTVDDFPVPKHFQKAYGMDVGWNNTAAIFGAWDKDNDIIYLYSEHKQGQAEPIIHASAIKGRGSWIRGTIDPAARGRSQIDGENLYSIYQKEGLKLIPALNAREAGLYEVWQRLSTGRLKIFKSCGQILREISLYHRGDKGQIVKTHDHLLDSLRYLCMAPANLWQWPQLENRPKVVPLNRMAGCV